MAALESRIERLEDQAGLGEDSAPWQIVIDGISEKPIVKDPGGIIDITIIRSREQLQRLRLERAENN